MILELRAPLSFTSHFFSKILLHTSKKEKKNTHQKSLFFFLKKTPLLHHFIFISMDSTEDPVGKNIISDNPGIFIVVILLITFSFQYYSVQEIPIQKKWKKITGKLCAAILIAIVIGCGVVVVSMNKFTPEKKWGRYSAPATLDLVVGAGVLFLNTWAEMPHFDSWKGVSLLIICLMAGVKLGLFVYSTIIGIYSPLASDLSTATFGALSTLLPFIESVFRKQRNEDYDDHHVAVDVAPPQRGVGAQIVEPKKGRRVNLRRRNDDVAVVVAPPQQRGAGRAPPLWRSVEKH